MNTKNIPAEISPADLHLLMKKPASFVILDVLTPEVHAESCLPGSTNACVYAVAFGDQVSESIPDKTTPIIFYGQSDDTTEADLAGDRLHALGYFNLTRLSGGIKAWRMAGFPIEGNDPVVVSSTDGSFPIDITASVILWTGRNRFNHHTGTLALASGFLEMANDRPTSGEFTIDMNSITCTDLKDPSANAGLVTHLRHDDFFAVDVFPTAHFVLKDGQPIAGHTEGRPTHCLKGDFSLRDITAPIEFKATLDPRPEGGWGAQALFSIDRTRWNVRYGSGRFFARLGQHLVSDHIHLHLKILTETKPLR